MADIRLNEAETRLWEEVGSRGAAFRRATRDRVFEQVRLTKKLSEIINKDGRMVDSISPYEPAPEWSSSPPPARASLPTPGALR